MILTFASKDLVHWTSDIVLAPDPVDPHLINYYDEPMGMSPFYAEGVVFGALKEKAVDLNRLANAINEGVPVYASPRAHRLLRAALEAVRPFSDNLADLLILNRRDWDRMISSGDTVLGAIAARPQGLSRLVLGLYQYVHKLGGPPPHMPDGSAEAPFTNFIGGSSSKQNRKDICGALPKQLRKQAPLCNGTF